MSYEAKPGSAAYKLIEHLRRNPSAQLHSDEVARICDCKTSDLTALMAAAYQAKVIHCRKDTTAGLQARVWSAGPALLAQPSAPAAQTSAQPAQAREAASTPVQAARAPAVSGPGPDASTGVDDIARHVPCGVVPRGAAPAAAPSTEHPRVKLQRLPGLPGNAVVHDHLPRPADTPRRSENPVRDALLALRPGQAVEFDTTEIRRFQMTAARITKLDEAARFTTARLNATRAATWRDA
jgi:hypothetical protein